MSHFLKGQGSGEAFNSGPELLPMLQSVCGQVTKLRLDDAAVVAEKEKKMMNGNWSVKFSEFFLFAPTISCFFGEMFVVFRYDKVQQDSPLLLREITQSLLTPLV